MNSSPNIAVVVTTISDGSFISKYVEAAKAYKAPERIHIYVIGDLNTPSECRDQARAAAAEGVTCEYWDVPEQMRWLRQFPKLLPYIPVQSDNRRNVGFLLAFRDGNDVLVSIDDDNSPCEPRNYFEQHAALGSEQELKVAHSERSWFNPYSLVRSSDPSGNRIVIYPRGFPYSERWKDGSKISLSTEAGYVAVNSGVCVGDPDVDAATRLTTFCHTEPAIPLSCLLNVGQRMPINSQNTSIIRRAIPCYYFALMGHAVAGLVFERFGDILSGYFLQMCVQAVGHRVRVGTPAAYQHRNAHNLYKDLSHELPGVVMLEEMIELLTDPLTPTSDYEQAYLEAGERLLRWSYRKRIFLWNWELEKYCSRLVEVMIAWVNACKEISGGRLG